MCLRKIHWSKSQVITYLFLSLFPALFPIVFLFIVNKVLEFPNPNTALSYSSATLACIAFIGIFRYENWIDKQRAIKRAESAANCYHTTRPFTDLLDSLTNNNDGNWQVLESFYNRLGENSLPQDRQPDAPEFETQFNEIIQKNSKEIHEYKSSVINALLYLDKEKDKEIIRLLTKFNRELDYIKHLYHGKAEDPNILTIYDFKIDGLEYTNRIVRSDRLLTLLRDAASL
ncbi:MAG: hypothetical protein ACI9YB_000574 [Halioglobus sp.]|jgi:hypothetical protein